MTSSATSNIAVESVQSGLWCLECYKEFQTSYLFKYFKHSVCDECHDPQVKHSLITKTEAKLAYFLTESDLNNRGTALGYLSYKNPHHPRWGDMKLYLLLQIEKLALKVWGEKALNRKHEKRAKQKIQPQIRKYNQELQKLEATV